MVRAAGFFSIECQHIAAPRGWCGRSAPRKEWNQAKCGQVDRNRLVGCFILAGISEDCLWKFPVRENDRGERARRLYFYRSGISIDDGSEEESESKLDRGTLLSRRTRWVFKFW